MADMKEMDLYGFLHPEITPDKEIIVSSRFKTKGGDPLPFVIRPLTQDICDAIQRGCIKTDKKGNQTFDRVKYVAETTAAAVVFPDLKNAELQKTYGVIGEVSLLKKMLYTNEYDRLIDEVETLSGLENFDDLKDEAKNA